MLENILKLKSIQDQDYPGNFIPVNISDEVFIDKVLSSEAGQILLSEFLDAVEVNKTLWDRNKKLKGINERRGQVFNLQFLG